MLWLLSILTSFQVLCVTKSWLKYFFSAISTFWKKSILTNFQVPAAPESWSEYTTYDGNRGQQIHNNWGLVKFTLCIDYLCKNGKVKVSRTFPCLILLSICVDKRYKFSSLLLGGYATCSRLVPILFSGEEMWERNIFILLA